MILSVLCPPESSATVKNPTVELQNWFRLDIYDVKFRLLTFMNMKLTHLILGCNSA